MEKDELEYRFAEEHDKGFRLGLLSGLIFALMELLLVCLVC